MTRREAVRVLLFERASLVGVDGGQRCAVVELSAVGALVTIVGRVPRPPLRLDFALGEDALALAVELKRVVAGRHVAVAFVDPPVDRLHRLIATEQRLALAAGRVNVQERRSRGPRVGVPGQDRAPGQGRVPGQRRRPGRRERGR